MPTVEINDTTLYYERTGQGPAMLFVHGMCGDAEVWADQARRFSDRFTCVRYDRRGHSRSARGNSTISDALHADDAAALIEALGLGPCLLVGSSGGAAIGVEVALRHGHLLRGAVFSEPPLFSLDPAAAQVAMRDLAPLVEQAIATGDRRAFVEAFFALMCPGLWSIIDETRKDRYRANADIGLADLRSPSLEVAPADLAAVTVPALIIAGTTSHPSLVGRPRAGGGVARRPLGRARGERPRHLRRAARRLRQRRLGLRRRAGRSHGGGTMRRFDVQSADETSLAVWADGAGTPLVLVHGSVSDHTTLVPLVDALLGEDVASFSMDRRGFGASGDAPGYAIERDFEDVAAVVDAVAARAGGPVALFGHSYGANCAMGGAALTKNVDHLVLYEPSLGLRYPAGSIDAVEQAVAAGDMDAAIIAVFVGILELSEEEIDAMRSSATPTWATRLASAPTLPRECRVEEGWVYQPGQFDAITAPTLLLAGSDTPADVSKATDQAADAIPDAQIRVLEGHAHMAHKTDPAMVAGLIRQFISS